MIKKKVVGKKSARISAKKTVSKKAKSAVARRIQAEPGAETLRFVEDLKRQWMATIDALIDPLMIVTKDHTITKANLALLKRSGLASIKKLIGKKCYKIFSGRSSPCPGCKMLSAAHQRTSGHFNLQDKEGNFFEVTSQPVITEDGSLWGVVQIYRDRTEATHLQEKLSQQDKLVSIGMLAGGVAHEINNPLGGIMVFSQMLLREIPKENPHYQDVKEIESAAIRCKDIVEQLLEFARISPGITSGKKDSHLETIDVIPSVRQALHYALLGKSQKNLTIDDQLGDQEVHVLGHKNKIIQIFLNIVNNGLQAMPKGGKLTLSLSKDLKRPKRIAIMVKDSGLGMSVEQQKRAFEPFYTTKEPGEGTGLGLSICYTLVKELGGDIEIQSAPKKGTTVKIWLCLPEN